jgi:hypothetical protein
MEDHAGAGVDGDMGDRFARLDRADLDEQR